MKSPESTRPVPNAEKDPLLTAKKTAVRKLLVTYDAVIAKAEQKKSLALLDAAERILVRAEKINTAKTVEEIEELMKEKRVFSPEHRQVLDSIFGTGNLDEAEIPDPTELTQAYFDTRYPKKTPEQIKEDKKKGFVCFRPDWWDKVADKSIVGADETWGTAYMRSIQTEAKALFETSVQIFSESIQKPNYTNGRQHYGSEEGTDPTLDPLLPIIHKVFGKGANRFNHSHDELVNQLIPKVEEKIRQQFKAKGLSVPGFKVMLEPAVVFNRQTMEKHPANSKTDTWERSSTTLLTQDNQDSGIRLGVGSADHGGAGYVNNAHRGGHGDSGGFRLAVVLEK